MTYTHKDNHNQRFCNPDIFINKKNNLNGLTNSRSNLINDIDRKRSGYFNSIMSMEGKNEPNIDIIVVVNHLCS